MNILNKLVPKFLRQFDQYLLLHHPVLWETRGHYFMFYSFVVVNSIVLGLGLLYPISLGQDMNFTFVRDMILVGNLVGMMVWAFFVYLQTFRRKLSYNWQESLMQLGVYALCLASLGINVLLFPNVVRMRATSLLSKEATLDAIHQYSQAKYLDDLTKKYTFSLESKPNASHYLKAIKNMALNQNNQVEAYFELQKELIKLFDAKTFPEYQQKKKIIDSFIEDNIKGNLEPETDISEFSFESLDEHPVNDYDEVASVSVARESYSPDFDVIQAFKTKLAFWKEDSTYLAQQIYAKSKWNKVFKQDVIRKNLHPSRLLNLYLQKDEMSSQMVYTNTFFKQGKMMQSLFKKFNIDPYQDKEADDILTSNLADLYQFHTASIFMMIYNYSYLNLEDDIVRALENHHYTTGTNYVSSMAAWTNTQVVRDSFQKWQEPMIKTSVLLRSFSVLFIFLTLLTLVVRLFNVRNLFISALVCMFGLWALAVSAMLFGEYFVDILPPMIVDGYYHEVRLLLFLYVPICLLILLQGLSLAYFFKVQYSQKWMRSWISILMSSSFFAALFTFGTLMQQRSNTWPNAYAAQEAGIMYSEYFTGLYIGIVVISVLGFVLYQAYQRLSYLPKMR